MAPEETLDFYKLRKVVEIYERRNPDDTRVRDAFNALRSGNARVEHLNDLDSAANSSNDWIHADYPIINRAARRAVRAALIIYDATASQIGVFGDGRANHGYVLIAMENADKLLEEVA